MKAPARILLVLEQNSDRQLLGAYLQSKFQVVFECESKDLINYSLIILDGLQFNKLRENIQLAKQQCDPVFLPVMMVSSRKELEYTVSHLWKTIDELLVTPVRKPELMARVTILIRAREQSVALRNTSDKLLWLERNRLALAVKSTKLAFWEWNPLTSEVFVSDEWKKQLGMEDGVDVGIRHNVYDFIHPADRDTFISTILENYNKQVESFQLQYRQILPNGSLQHFLTQAATAKDPETGDQVVFGANVNITELINLHEQLRLLRRAVDQSLISVLITAANGNIIYCNPAFSNVTGYAQKEVEGRNPRILKSGFHSEEFYRQMWATLTEGRTWEGELVNRKKNGELYWEKAVITPVYDEGGSKITHYIAIKEDITQLKQAIRELLIAREKAVESDKLKTVFLQNLSHEIRTPMNSILGFLELIQTAEPDDYSRNSFIERVVHSGNRMLKTMSELIEMAKIAAGSVEVYESKFYPSHMLRELAEAFEIQARQKGLVLTASCDPTAENIEIRADKFKLMSALVKLLDNAVKFTPAGSVCLTCKKLGNDLIFEVSDTGAGIHPDRQKAVFESFVQADLEITRSHEGAGIGLSIARAYAEMMGGKLWLESEVGKGTKVYLTITYQIAD